jgi:hypothetical protein
VIEIERSMPAASRRPGPLKTPAQIKAFTLSYRREDQRTYMGHSPTGKAITNESDYPYIVEIAVADGKLDVEVGRRMMDFHKSRKIQARHGRRIFREPQSYFRWCFSDLATARAFLEQFGGELFGT